MESDPRISALVRRGQRTFVIIGALLLALATCVAVGLGFAATSVALTKLIVPSLFLLLLAGGGGLVFWLGVRSPDRDPAVRVLLDAPQRVVWVYAVRQMSYGNTSAATVVLGLDDGRLLRIPAPVGGDEELLALVSARTPHASRGFDRSLSHRFASDPRSLRLG
jgi:hypothetical protein